ncbi:MAG: valine--tRNA ligase [Lentisphaerae bacterium GWF2_45_14]|nr:MAG: valine--tRNA ligase [Lentisphaerae bacterium GWF2_45_14]
MSSEAEMPKAYEPSAVEDKWYPHWETKGYFRGRPNPAKKPYSIVIPPPNVTGILTMGHVLNNTLQDILIRWHRMQGHEVCWFPGTDHAGIATESKVERMLKEKENTGRDKLGREEFIKRVWEWKEQYGGTIIQQLRKLGTSCDWEKERFTMDEGLSHAVRKVFVELYNKGYIYRGRRMINWCPVSKTALSDEEVIYKESNGKFYHFRYPLTDGSGFLAIATTRPETMLGDSAVAVHPDDPRHNHLIGKTVDLPLTNRKIPVIGDEHADPEKGTGCVKITPAHDPNDFAVGQRHNLEFINVMNKDASMNKTAGPEFEGLDRFECRKKVLKMMDELGFLDRIEDIVHSVGHSERGDVPIETMLSEQWFVNMSELAKPAMDAVRTGKINFHPDRWAKTYFHWMENIKDWCISRQIWWGHRIPAWYNEKTGETYVGLEEPSAPGPWRQDEDVLDTWFSSWLWPFSIMGWPDKTEDLKYFYPTSDLVTGPDIIFFWVARMIMAGYEFMGELPFRNVYFTSIIRDDLGRKLSKSLGNSPDPLDVIKQYGADALRFSIIYIAPVGMDIRYSNDKCELGRNFANKLWNACRFRKIQGELSPNFKDLSGIELGKLSPDETWIISRLEGCADSVNKSLTDFQFHMATHEIYELVWSSFCDWFIESCKVRIHSGGEEKVQALAVLDFVLYKILRLLHPFMPFITEELAHQMGFLKDGDSIMFAEYPGSGDAVSVSGKDVAVIGMVESKFQLIRAGRNLRVSSEIPAGKKLNYYIQAVNPEMAGFLKSETDSLKRMLNAENLEIALEPYPADDGQAPSMMVDAGNIYLPLKGAIDVDSELNKLAKQRDDLIKWISASMAKLSNEKFVAKAPGNVVAEAKAHLAEMEDKLLRVEELIKSLS